MSGVKMHRGAGHAAILGGVALLATVLSTRSASAAVFTLDDVTLPGDPIQIVNGVNDSDTSAGVPPATQGVEHAIDNNTNKYLNFLDYGSGFIVTPSRGASVVRAIRLYTADDATERDPASFLLEGANSPTGPFTVIYGSNVTLPGGPNATGGVYPPNSGRNGAGQVINPNTQNFVDVAFGNATQYTSYRVTFPTLRDGQAANSMQIGEVELLGTVVPEPATLGLIGLGALGLLRRRRA